MFVLKYIKLECVEVYKDIYKMKSMDDVANVFSM